MLPLCMCASVCVQFCLVFPLQQLLYLPGGSTQRRGGKDLEIPLMGIVEIGGLNRG